MRRVIRRFLHRLPYIKGLHEQITKEGAWPAGHYHSPVPDQDEISAYIDSRKPASGDLPDVDLNKENQFGLLKEYLPYYEDLPFPEKPNRDCRYYYENSWFGYSDAIFLYSFLRKHQPRTIIEIGSGFSSAVVLDTVERFFPSRPEIVFIDPNPDRLNRLLSTEDKERVKIVDRKIQEVPFELFPPLAPGDLLLIDSSHVVKCGSDLQVLMFDVLPHLPPGIFVNFHDVFYPFEYPSEWLTGGRYWNENYFLRAFLSYNREWEIYFFNNYVTLAFKDFLRENMPLCTKNPGGSLLIRRKSKS